LAILCCRQCSSVARKYEMAAVAVADVSCGVDSPPNVCAQRTYARSSASVPWAIGSRRVVRRAARTKMRGALGLSVMDVFMSYYPGQQAVGSAENGRAQDSAFGQTSRGPVSPIRVSPQREALPPLGPPDLRGTPPRGSYVHAPTPFVGVPARQRRGAPRIGNRVRSLYLASFSRIFRLRSCSLIRSSLLSVPPQDAGDVLCCCACLRLRLFELDAKRPSSCRRPIRLGTVTLQTPTKPYELPTTSRMHSP